ncbi:MAG: hypothetical protein KJ587_19680 [Alphaproteobacteria bacterium]|nr:hypothetical protein [Alphaproteobacteria bacterium]
MRTIIFDCVTVHAKMLESLALIKTLAGQNPQLVSLIEKNRIRILWLAGVTHVIEVLVLIRLISNLIMKAGSMLTRHRGKPAFAPLLDISG